MIEIDIAQEEKAIKILSNLKYNENVSNFQTMNESLKSEGENMDFEGENMDSEEENMESEKENMILIDIAKYFEMLTSIRSRRIWYIRITFIQNI